MLARAAVARLGGDPPSLEGLAVEDGDEAFVLVLLLVGTRFDAESQELRVELSDDELAERLRDWRAPEPRYKTGVLAKYAALVSSASEGAITRPPQA